jgi:signal transduction histidine kinase/ligand-binding sensor domain-containing protein
MSQTPNKKPAHTFLLFCSFAISLIAASCSGSATPTIVLSQSEEPSDSSSDNVTDWPDSSPGISSGQYLRFETISLEQGLSQSTIFSMLQDSQGFMWFGTESGLNKYDGYTFTLHQHNPDDPNSLSSNWISALIEDDAGFLWIGTSDGGLDRFNRKLEQFTHFHNDPEDPTSLSSDGITALYQDRNGEVWIGTGSGLDKFDQENERFIHYQHDPANPNSVSSNAITAIHEDQGGGLWVGTDSEGLNRFEPENKRWRHFRNDPDDPRSLSHDSVSAIFHDQSGTLWIGTNGGGLNSLVLPPAGRDDLSDAEELDQEIVLFNRYQHDPDDRDSLSDNDIRAIYQDRGGDLWIGTYFGGLNRFDPEKERFTHFQHLPYDSHSLSSNAVMSIFQDHEGLLWFGTHSGGVNKLDVGSWNFAHYKNDPDNPNSLNDNMVWALSQDQEDDLWIGTMFGGLNRFDRETGDWDHYIHNPDDPNSLSHDWVAAIYVDPMDELWIGTRSGLDRFDPQFDPALGGGTFTHYQADPDAFLQSSSNDITAIYPAQDGNLWIGTADGLYRFDRENESWTQHYYLDADNPESQSNVVLSIIEDRDGMLWIGTIGGGLTRINPDTETLSSYFNDPDDPQSLSNNIVLSIIQDHNGTLWAGTPDGLNKFDQETETFTRYREKDGLANDNVYCLAEDKGGLIWLSTNKGLSSFDPQRNKFRNYSVTNGLQSNEFNITSCTLSDSAEMFFGGINGFNAFFPDQIHDNPVIPPIVLTSLAQDGENLDQEIVIESVTEITFKWPDNSFEFEFAALSYAHPEMNQYAYLLDGFDEDWNDIGSRRYGKYTNLPGGTYTLRLRGSNNNGVWNEDGTAVKITIVPPFWATWWFQGIVLLALAGSVYTGYQLRVRNLETRGRELEIKVDERTAKLMKIEAVVKQGEMEKAITAERNRLARDLHDSITQALYSQTLFAEATARLLSAGDVQTATDHVNELRHSAQQALQEMRLLIYELRPSVLSEEGLISALQLRLESVEERSGFTTEFKVDMEIEIPSNIEESLYWISQEALNNIVKHAQASKVTLSLEQEKNTIVLDIVDNGRGFDAEKQSQHGGLGLLGIQERVDQLNGKMTIESQPGNGTRVRVELNL